MFNRHEQDKKQFRRLFKQEGLDRFEERFQVLEAFLKLEHHVSVQEISEQLKADGTSMSDEFIAQSMEQLCRFGFANQVNFHKDNIILYEHRHLGVHHDHMICTKCGAILEFKDEAIEERQRKLARAYGFHMLQHKMEIYGLCSKCMALREKLVPLSKAKPGERLIVKSVEAGRKMQLRISSMGLKIGDVVELVSNGIGGQVVVALGENRLVIGTGMAEKIWGTPMARGCGCGHTDFLTCPRKRCRKGIVKLCQMKAGQEGRIVRVSGESVLRRRLLEMGINRGTQIYVEKYAPLKDPLELVVKGYHISLRVEEAGNILVEDVRVREK
ncbi:MAG: FeoA domain-containing protein [Desulfobacter sp.]|nr:MAG: FeoA domain-containing protein [Desulfobacter sp.]